MAVIYVVQFWFGVYYRRNSIGVERVFKIRQLKIKSNALY